MYNLSHFTPYTPDVNHPQITKGEQVVLAWSKESGYHFIQFGFITNEKVIAV